jgi:hypothetical protein
LFLYIKGTINLGIYYQRREANIFIGFSYVDWAEDLQEKKSTTGMFLGLDQAPLLGEAGSSLALLYHPSK